jgi:hypothetical protein
MGSGSGPRQKAREETPGCFAMAGSRLRQAIAETLSGLRTPGFLVPQGDRGTRAGTDNEVVRHKCAYRAKGRARIILSIAGDFLIVKTA